MVAVRRWIPVSKDGACVCLGVGAFLFWGRGGGIYPVPVGNMEHVCGRPVCGQVG